MLRINAVKYVKSSPRRLTHFKKCVEYEKVKNKGLLVLDVPTRGSFTYLMLDDAIKLRKDFERMEENDEDGHYLNYFGENNSGKKQIGPSSVEN